MGWYIHCRSAGRGGGGGGGGGQDLMTNSALTHVILFLCSLKKGPLFKFDVHEDVRLINDAMMEKDEV